MWELVQLTAEGPNETLGEYATEDEALAAGNDAADFSETVYVVREDGEDRWTNEGGPFERV